jgi:beta-lactamase superfamily II metal-dependent hydrolase
MSNSIYLYALDAENGDCLLLVNDSTNYTVLIDSGPKSSSVSTRLIKRIKSIISERAIDLAIVTHNDDDHIGGFKSFLNQGLVTKKFIFNHHDFIDKVLNRPRDVKVSLKQDIELESTVRDIIIPLEMSDNGYFSDMIFDEFRIKFRSPNKPKLESYSNWLRLEKNKKRNVKVANGKQSISISDCRKHASDDNFFIEDKREPNGSSLALDISFHSYRVLLLGDAHPTAVIESYKNEQEEKIEYDLVKLSHHGSEKNTNNQLLNMFHCRNYLICSNADNNHNHPSPTTIFRILNNKASSIYITKNSNKVEDLERTLKVKLNKPNTDYLEFKYEF